MAKHAPAPWRAEGAVILDADGNHVANVIDDSCLDGDSTMEADARLIAAAPALLTACKTFLECAGIAHEHWDADRDHKVGKMVMAMAGFMKGYRADLTAAHAAIAEATGEKTHA